MAGTPSKRTTAKKAAPKKGPAAKSKQGNARALTAGKKLADSAAQVRAAREAAQDMEVTEASAWKGAKEVEAVKVMLPSGNVCLAMNRGLDFFLEKGKIPNALMGMMEDAQEGQRPKLGSLREVAKDPAVLAEVMGFMDEVVLSCVVAPALSPVPQEGDSDYAKRDSSKLYVDQLDIMDKQFFLSWVMGGTRDLERFRDEQASMLEALEDVDGVGDTAE